MNTLFDKVLGENEKCVFYFYLKKPKALFGPPNNLNFHEIITFLIFEELSFGLDPLIFLILVLLLGIRCTRTSSGRQVLAHSAEGRLPGVSLPVQAVHETPGRRSPRSKVSRQQFLAVYNPNDPGGSWGLQETPGPCPLVGVNSGIYRMVLQLFQAQAGPLVLSS